MKTIIRKKEIILICFAILFNTSLFSQIAKDSFSSEVGNKIILTSTDTIPPSITGQTGKVTFLYRGKKVSYTTVLAADGNLWLQQNLGSERVAITADDSVSYGDLFQWGRWDDGHQLRNSSIAAIDSLSVNNPSGIHLGDSNFYIVTFKSYGEKIFSVGLLGAALMKQIKNSWWNKNQGTWDANSPNAVTADSGCDPCKIIGAGWHLPTVDDWKKIMKKENIGKTISTSFKSNLKLSAAGFRSMMDGKIYFAGTGGKYWSTDLFSFWHMAKTFAFGQNAHKLAAYKINAAWPGDGLSVRCLKYLQN